MTTETTTEIVSKAVSPIFRIDYPNLYEAKRAKRGNKEVGDPKFGCTLVIDQESLSPEDKLRLDNLKAVAKAVAKAKWPGANLSDIRFPFKDGTKEADRLEARAKKEGKERDFSRYHGKILLKTSSKFQPQVVGVDRKEILDPKRVYAGCLCYAELNFVAWPAIENDENSKDSVTAYVNFVMSTGKGDKYYSGKSAADVFAGVGGVQSNEDPTEAWEKDDEIPF